MARTVQRFILLALVSIASAARAEAPLSAAEVRGFAASLAAIEELAARHEAAGLDLESASADNLANPMSAAIRQMQAQRVLGEFEVAMRRHGFADAAHWSRVGDRVYRAYFALTTERVAVEARAEIQQALKESEDDPNLGPDEKRALREMMNGALAGIQAAVQSSEADKTVVAAHLTLIEQAWKLD